MTGQDIITEVKARGFDYVSDTRILTWANRQYHRINDSEAWDFLEAETTGTAPLTISDLRAVLSVISTTSEVVVEWDDIRTIREYDPDLTSTGTPEWWYLDDGAITTYPESSDTLSVRYIKTAADITTGTEPIWPDRYHYILVDLSVLEAYKDSDNFDSFNALRPLVEEDLAVMRSTLLVPNYDSAARIAPSWLASTDW